MKRIKKNISQTLDIDCERLNEISLEDVEIDQSSQQRIYKALYDMALLNDLYAHLSDLDDTSPGVPCTGFWVEDTQELILFAWSQYKTKTIIIPPEEWFLRDDITVH